MVRIKFVTDKDRIQGNYLLATNTVVRRLKGQIFEIAERDLRLLNENKILYEILPIPDPSDADETVRNPLTVEL
jgi:hypothetical protein